jgi:transposase-like protein
VDEKLSLILQVLRGSKTVADVCREQGVAPNQFYRWRDAFLEAGKQGLADKRRPQNRDPLQEENRRLKRLLAEQILINDAQKKLYPLNGEASE